MRTLLATLALAALALPLRAQEVDVSESRPARVTPLFAADAPVAFRLEANLKQVFRDRDTTEIHWFPARISWVAPEDSGSMDIEVATRGHFRLQRGNCSFPPIRLRFPREERRGTLWRGQGTLKVGGHCRSGNRRYEQITHQEFLAYRVFNTLTDSSFRVRFAHATYVDTGDNNKVVEAPAFFIEDVDDMARRLGMTKFEHQGIMFDDTNPGATALVSTFLWMIGGTDWSLPFQHNIRVLMSEQGKYVMVPYDFDWTGIVNAPYAVPAPQLPIRNVRQRLWRGPCLTPEDFRGALDRIEAKREAIYALYNTWEGLAESQLKHTTKYLDDYFKAVDNLLRKKPTLQGVCGL
jgi:hypothetical protein